MKRAVILYLATLIVMVPLDFLFLGVLAKDFFKAQVGPALGDVNILPAVIFYLLYPVGDRDLREPQPPATNWQHTLALWRAVRAVLLRHFRSDGAGAAEGLDLARGARRYRLGHVRDRDLPPRSACCSQTLVASRLRPDKTLQPGMRENEILLGQRMACRQQFERDFGAGLAKQAPRNRAAGPAAPAGRPCRRAAAPEIR